MNETDESPPVAPDEIDERLILLTPPKGAAARPSFQFILLLLGAHALAATCLAIFAIWLGAINRGHFFPRAFLHGYLYGGFAAGEFCLVGAWLAWGKVFIGFRIVGAFVLTAFLYALAVIVTTSTFWLGPPTLGPGQNLHDSFWSEIFIFLLSSYALVGLIATSLWLLRLAGVTWSLQVTYRDTADSAPENRQVRILDLFLFTTAVAVVLAIAPMLLSGFRFGWNHFLLWVIWLGIVGLICFVQILVAAAPRTLTRSFIYQLIFWAFYLSGLLAWDWLRTRNSPFGGPPIWETALLLASAAIAHGLPVSATLWVLRIGGYRLKRGS